MYFTECFPDISGTHLASHIVLTILLTVFPMLYFTSLGLFCNHQFVLLTPFIFFNWSLKPLPSGNHQLVLCVCVSVSVSFTYSVLSIPHVSKITWCLFLWLISLSIIPSRSIHAVTKGKISFFFYGRVLFHCMHAPRHFYSLICWLALGCFHV